MPSSSMEKLDAWNQIKQEAANLSIEEWDELLKSDEEDVVLEQHTDKKQ